MSTDLTFITNDPGKSLCDRFGVLLGEDTPELSVGDPGSGKLQKYSPI